MTDPPIEHSALGPREFIAAALAVLGCLGLAETAVGFAQFVLLLPSGMPARMLLAIAPATALMLFFVLGRNRMAARLTAKDPVTGWHLDWRQLQQAAIQVMGVCFMASGLQGLQFVGPEETPRLHDHSIRPLSFLRIEPESVATFAIGTILTLAASSVHGWIVRDRVRKPHGLEPR